MQVPDKGASKGPEQVGLTFAGNWQDTNKNEQREIRFGGQEGSEGKQ